MGIEASLQTWWRQNASLPLLPLAASSLCSRYEALDVEGQILGYVDDVYTRDVSIITTSTRKNIWGIVVGGSLLRATESSVQE